MSGDALPTPLQPKVYREGKSFQLADGSFKNPLEYQDFVELSKLKDQGGKSIAKLKRPLTTIIWGPAANMSNSIGSNEPAAAMHPTGPWLGSPTRGRARRRGLNAFRAGGLNGKDLLTLLAASLLAGSGGGAGSRATRQSEADARHCHICKSTLPRANN